VHRDDILEPTNWEAKEPFLRKYWHLLDDSILAIANRWRRERGEPELVVADLMSNQRQL
jgi:hypothetical protein